MMAKTPLSVNKDLMNIQNKKKSDSSTIKPSSSSVKRKRNSNGAGKHERSVTTTTSKENVSNNTQTLSDISDDEPMDVQASSSKVNRMSSVYEYATKLSPQEYQFKLCLKVRAPLI